MHRIQKVIGSAVVLSAMALLPLTASASVGANLAASSGIVISPSGLVRVIGADVTSVANGVVDATLSLGNTVLDLVVNPSATTTVMADGSKTASTSAIAVGDKIALAGSLSSSSGNTLTVAASKIRDLTTFPVKNFIEGTISSIDNAAASFILTTHGNKSVTVDTNGSTLFKLNGATSTLSSLAVNEKVSVAGIASSDGSVITASRVSVRAPVVTPMPTPAPVKNQKDIHGGMSIFGGFHFGRLMLK